MPGFKKRDFDRAIARELQRTEAIKASQPLIGEDEFVTLAEQIQKPGPRDRFIQDFVAGALLSPGDEPLATSAPRRQIPEPDAARAGRRGAEVGQHHLYAVPPMGQLIDATGRFAARRRNRNHFDNGSAA